MTIAAGDAIRGKTATDEWADLVAVEAPKKGRDFWVVWVCTPEEYESSLSEEREPDAIPWPLDAIEQPERV